MKFPTEAIEALILAKGNTDPGGYGDRDWAYWYWYVTQGTRKDVFGLFDVTLVELTRGHEGDWEKEIKLVFKVEHNDGTPTQYFKKTGTYASHCGTDFDGPFTEVKVITKVIEIYEDED